MDPNNSPLTNALLALVHGSPSIDRHFSRDRCCSEFSANLDALSQDGRRVLNHVTLQSRLLSSCGTIFTSEIPRGFDESLYHSTLLRIPKGNKGGSLRNRNRTLVPAVSAEPPTCCRSGVVLQAGRDVNEPSKSWIKKS